MSQIQQVQQAIESFFKNNSTWSLSRFLQYRNEAEDYTYDKRQEHKTYKKALVALSEDPSYAQQAQICLSGFENEKSSTSIENFWISIDKKLATKKLERIEDHYDLTIADEVTQQMTTYIRSTTTRVTERFLNSCETSSQNRSTENQEPVEVDDDTLPPRCYYSPLSSLQHFGEQLRAREENTVEEAVEEAENVRKRLLSESTGYEQNEGEPQTPSNKTQVLPGEKLIYNNVDILSFACSKMKKIELAKSSLSIGVVNIHNISCTKFLPLDFKQFISDQIQNCETTAVHFADGRFIDKFIMDCEEEVLIFLDKFQDIGDLASLSRCLNENQIDISVASNDLIFVRNLFDHFYFLFKNETLLQPMSEQEFGAYVWTPLIRNAFLGKDDLKLSCGELASKSYEKLKELLDVASRGGPKLDGKGLLKSLGTEILALEDGVFNTHSKRTGDLQKLEYCSKVILTALFFALPSATKNSITDIETYTLQSNEFHLKISASKYLFTSTVITMDLQHVEIPRTAEGFSKLVVGVKTILFWKVRTRKNTMKFYEVLNKEHKRLTTNGVFFSPVKMAI
ncbi:hypothetical protein C1646_672811 [Rhizophagus diaphanus]|nr:hypothetical protein C1646_672811 [Rhizophagus diaphanus] [Rhizophagus sp. MUCL 43196]